MKLNLLVHFFTAAFGFCVCAEDAKVGVANARLTKSSPLNFGDFNIVFDVVIRSDSKDGLFANISSIGGCYFKDAEFVFDDGRKLRKFGTTAYLPLSRIETETYVFVTGDESRKDPPTKVATICTDLKDEMASFDSLTDIENVKIFKGSVKTFLTTFNIRTNKFFFYNLKVDFTASRLPTGGVFDLAMGDVVIEENKTTKDKSKLPENPSVPPN